MRRKPKPKTLEKPLKQEIKTEFTQNSDDQEISLEISKGILDSNEDPSETLD